jgi:CheY-like chemotaxis protein
MLGCAGTPRSILIVDDEPEVLNLLRFVLEGEGYEIRSAQNGKQAIAQLKQASVGIVLTDLAMPEQDGIETILAIRKQYPDLKVVAMSGTFADSVLDAARHLGADAVLAKPIEVDELLRTLQELH